MARNGPPSPSKSLVPDASPDADWPDPVLDHYWLNHVLGIEPRLNIQFVLWRGGARTRWLELHKVESPQPFHFDIHYGKRDARDAYLADCFARAQRTATATRGHHHGFDDLIFPLFTDERGGTFVHVGQFRMKPLAWDELTQLWLQLTGRQAIEEDHALRRFVEVALDVPVLTPEFLAAIEEHLALLRSALCDDPGRSKPLYSRVLELRQELLLHHYAPARWAGGVVDPDAFGLLPWQLERRFAEWMQEEFGLRRVPTTVMVIQPLLGRADPLRVLLLARDVQAAVATFARAGGESAAAPLGRHAVLLVTSARERLRESGRRSELVERAHVVRAHVWRTCRVDCAVGVGGTTRGGESLHPSYEGAMLALHRAIATDERVVLASENADATEPVVAVHRLGRELLRSLEAGGRAVEVTANRYLEALSLQSGHSLELVRSQLQHLLLDAWHATPVKLPRAAGDRDPLALLATTSSHEAAFSIFRAELHAWVAHLDRGVRDSREDFGRVLRFVDAHIHEPLRLGDVARRVGYSPSTLSRAFRRVTGTTFVRYLMDCRLDCARGLLRTTELGIERIAEASGFRSGQHFSRTFKQYEGVTPSEYRRRLRFDSGGEPARRSREAGLGPPGARHRTPTPRESPTARSRP